MELIKSKELINIKKVNEEKKKKVLFINSKIKNTPAGDPSNELAVLATILKNRGHEVLVVDYAFLRKEQSKDALFFIRKLNSDIIWIDISPQNEEMAEEIISKINNFYPKTPLLVSGQYPTLYTRDLKKDKRIDYIFVGESELTIVDAVEKAKKEKNPVIIHAKGFVDLNCLPFPDFRTFYGWESIRGYPLMTSRGCANQCSFCVIGGINKGRWRSRNPEDCIREIEFAKNYINPYLHICVRDSNPAVDKKRFCKFLELFYKKIKGCTLHILHMRADGIDENVLKLMKKCRCSDINIGVEHINPEVFKFVNKGESIKQIINACKLIKKYKFRLGLFFVLGLPYDNLKRTEESIKFYKKMKADYVNFGLIVPYKGTAAGSWFKKYGSKINNELGVSVVAPNGFETEEPCVETKDFTKEERKKAYYIFLFKTAQTRLRLKWLARIFEIARKYKLYSEFFCWFPHGILESFRDKFILSKVALNVYKKEGLVQLIRRYNRRNRV